MPPTMAMGGFDQRGWNDRRTATPDPRIAIVWEPCGGCWGQRMILDEAIRARRPCPYCIGIGQKMKITKESKCA